MKAIHGGKAKNDKIDAHKIAVLLRGGMLPQAYVYPAEMRATIFQPFQRGRGEQAAPGSGIGLSLVARFAELHGGRAWVEERPGGGASFRVSLAGAFAEA